ncbi:type II toxin-antitoxin system Phd/YefM family antitoxin [Pseudomethylobacillus aquaticus]|uniref:Antitoxin n=1 Tax=Pseudomethylobacillus aquaticus TaxID=2676064 RepID=A0A3N0V2Y5_9PROT|nr:type II toxin-antitoxin system Phd/YefM family antitoxin [Pseudomethylobacillus aquaticus]ROH87167.1 type II toxin-antitoxin system Phd/YefM family antitoxin [Pseudomethylobacillus aquaticus]
MDTILTNSTVSVTDLKRNYAEIVKQANESAIAILNHNRPEAYLLAAANYERLMAYLEDLEDAKLAQERANGPFVDVNLSDL